MQIPLDQTLTRWEKKKNGTLDEKERLPNPRSKWYTLLTQNRQPLHKRPLLPLIEQGGRDATMWDRYSPYYSILIPNIHVHTLHIDDLPTPSGFLLIAGNLHDNMFLIAM